MLKFVGSILALPRISRDECVPWHRMYQVGDGCQVAWDALVLTYLEGLTAGLKNSFCIKRLAGGAIFSQLMTNPPGVATPPCKRN